MKLLLIAYPHLSREDFSFIQDIRREHDKMYPVVEPHFTLVFPVEGWTEAEFATAIKEQASGFNAFSFVIRCAKIHKDEFTGEWYVFLVPDEGHSQFINWHDRLYAGALQERLRHDIDYTPHITIGSSIDPDHCKTLVEKINAKGIQLAGDIVSLDIIAYKGGVVTTFDKIVG